MPGDEASGSTQQRARADGMAPVPHSQVSVKTVATVSAVALGAVLLAWIVVHSLVSIAFTIGAVLLAVTVENGVERIQELGIPRGWAIFIAISLLVLAVVGVCLLVIPPAVVQLEQLASHLPKLVDRAQHSSAYEWLARNLHLQKPLQSSSSTLLRESVAPLLTVIRGVIAGVAGAVTLLFLVIFMVAFGGALVRRLLVETLPDHRARYERVLGKVYRSMGGYLSGLGMIAALNATLTSTFLAIAGVPFFLPLGILSGLGSLLPLVGAAIAGVVLTAVAFISGGLWLAVATAAYVLVYQLFENHVVGPVVYRHTVQLNPLLTLVGVLFMAELAGVVGAILAVPVIAVAQIVLTELLLLRRERLGLPLEGDVAKPRRRGFGIWRRPRPA